MQCRAGVCVTPWSRVSVRLLCFSQKRGMVLQGIFLFVFGPGLAGLISPNLMEQASIWCFFSIAQIAIMLFCVREALIINWGRSGHQSLVSGSSTADKAKPKAA